MDRRRITIGRRGEQVAADYLGRKGYRVLERNYRTKWGEVDIVAKEGQQVVFVEVKAKTSDKFGAPWEMVNSRKVEQVARMGQEWVRERGWAGLVRVDVVGVVLSSRGEPEVDHYKNVTE